MERIGSDSTRSPPLRGAAGVPGSSIPGLREGASIVFKALSPSAEGRWTVLVRGVPLDAAVSTPLKAGLLYSARAERLPDGAWALRVQGPAGEGRAADFLLASGLPGDVPSVLILRALMAEGLPLDPRQITRLRGALLRKGADEDRAALLARALAKDLDPEAYADAVDAASGGDGRDPRPGGGSTKDRGNGPGSRAGGEGKGDAGDPEPASDGPGENGPGDDPEVLLPGPAAWRDLPATGSRDPEGIGDLAALLRTLAGRSGDRPDPRQLFNARSGPRGRWIYVPYRFERGGVAFSGTLRILVPEGGTSASVLSADVRVEGSAGNGRYGFELRGAEGGLRLTLSAPAREDRDRLERRREDLQRSLAAYGCRLDVTEPGEPVPEYPGVDDHA